MDDVTFAARRATSGSKAEQDLETRFRGLVQSPLRAGILRFLSARPEEAFDTESLMQTFGRMRLDVDNCVRELVDFGVVTRSGDEPAVYRAARPEGPLGLLLDTFLERRANVGVEESSPSVQRFREMIGRDEKMLAIFEWIRTAAKSDISVLILGPTGAGKEVVARMIHELSRRGPERFQAVNCAALPDTLFESEIFGYEKGAFTGAHDRKPGRLEMANGGTLFLDEIGDLSLVAQAKLLRVLEERRFERLGRQPVHPGGLPPDLGHQPAARPVRAREPVPRRPVLPHQRLRHPAAVAEGARERHPGARQPVPGPVLRRQRPSAGCQAALGRGRRAARELSLAGQHPRAREHGLAGGAVGARTRHPRRPTSSSCTRTLARPAEETASPGLPTLRDAERAHIIRVLDAASWNKVEAARILDISRGTLYRKIEEFGLEPTASERQAPAPEGRLAGERVHHRVFHDTTTRSSRARDRISIKPICDNILTAGSVLRGRIDATSVQLSSAIWRARRSCR